MNLTSNAFADKELIPPQYTCDGENYSPPLKIEKVPENAESLALIADDPDAPNGTFVHWVRYNMPSDKREIPERTPTIPQLADKSLQGKNSFGKIGYGGPCPPSGTHRYFFKLYALDTSLDLNPDATTKKELENAMRGHILSEAELVGLYSH
ncbi:MAG: hypothetical protein ACD_20C00137G0012 [uncultured bacterium]|nr:MAG: hypothetical protein ACD_20C00137G0012 [uncultured bacterium]HBH19069.1 YbhB/YbcL family Raf kinase inhibitor-like protein [Cyanobacteria bacterium UBA9579]